MTTEAITPLRQRMIERFRPRSRLWLVSKEDRTRLERSFMAGRYACPRRRDQPKCYRLRSDGVIWVHLQSPASIPMDRIWSRLRLAILSWRMAILMQCSSRYTRISIPLRRLISSLGSNFLAKSSDRD